MRKEDRQLFNHGDDVLEVIIRDQYKGMVECRKANLADKKEINKILNWLKYKYDMQWENNKDNGLLDIDSEFLKF